MWIKRKYSQNTSVYEWNVNMIWRQCTLYTPVYFLPYMMEMEIYWVQPQLRSAESQSDHQQQQTRYWSNNSPHPVPCDAVWHRVTPVTLVTHPPPPHYTSATLQSLGVRTFLNSKSPNLVKTTGKIWVLSWDTWQTLTRQNVTQITTTSTGGLAENTLLLDM